MTLGLGSSIINTGINYITSIGLKALLMNPTFNQLQNLNLSIQCFTHQVPLTTLIELRNDTITLFITKFLLILSYMNHYTPFHSLKVKTGPY